MQTLVANSADNKQVKRAADKETLRRERETNDLKSLLETVHGRRFLRRMIVEVAGIYRSSYLGGPTGRGSDPAFLEGQRNVGLQLLAEVQTVNADLWLLAEREHNETLQAEGLK